MESAALDFARDDRKAGFRLRRAEIYNWGTFHRRVWTLEPGGLNCLITGDIGSGKSTFIDALTTLLVPAQRITYNKAAGAEQRERTLRSYVLGYYKSERAEAGLSARPVALRDRNEYSVILAQFHNSGFDRDLTVAQVFWIGDPAAQPDRFYIVADQPLSIADDFSDFGNDLKNLRKRLREQPRVQLFDSFPPYGAALRRGLGIDNEQALDLFNQTVSMKSVGNLTEFVRQHMLRPADTAPRISELIAHFDDLNRAHEAVLKAKAQIDQLQPIVADAREFSDLDQQTLHSRACRDALAAWFDQIKIALLDARLEQLQRDRARLDERLQKLEQAQRDRRIRRDEIAQAISANGGDRLRQLRREISQLTDERDRRRKRADQYRELIKALDLPDLSGVEVFHDNREAIRRLDGEARERQATLQNQRTDREIELRQHAARRAELDAEIKSLRARRSNLPAAMLALRDQLCQALSLSADELPFIGELIQVRDDERDWEGAIERLLHNFALSLLVPDEHYRVVAEWVDRTHLRGRLVYYRVLPARGAAPGRETPEALSRKLAIKPDSAMYGWLERELATRFDHVCCADMQRFRREHKAVTRAGQIKSGRVRHEKDDRHRLDDRTRYVLGWTNEEKIRALEQQRTETEKRAQQAADAIAELDRELQSVAARLNDLARLEMFQQFDELDWRAAAAEIAELQAELKDLEEQSDILATLQQQQRELDRELDQADQELGRVRSELGGVEQKRRDAEEQREQCRATLSEADGENLEPLFESLQAARSEAIGDAAINLKSIDARQREFRDWLTARIDAGDKRLKRLNDKIVSAMKDYQHRWPVETREVDASVEAASEYRAMLESLSADDLPRFEKRFKSLLNENTINEVAGFQAVLQRERQQIDERIEIINRSLHQIDYEKGRYIRLLAERSTDAEVREFQQQLRACTEGTITGTDDDQYSERKFLQVRAIIERFRGREGSAEIDRRWTRKVTDVRNWFVFSASERWREDDSEHEHYADAGGKSGGQKEKLAYTVLAASLAYQFGLEQGETRSRSFRFVVIDEAFGRGSDESARYGLELFGRLNLQLLIVTPLQKIHIIEPFVASVGFVHNPEGRESMLRNLGIEDYRREKAEREQGASDEAGGIEAGASS